MISFNPLNLKLKKPSGSIMLLQGQQFAHLFETFGSSFRTPSRSISPRAETPPLYHVFGVLLSVAMCRTAWQLDYFAMGLTLRVGTALSFLAAGIPESVTFQAWK